MTIPIHTLRLLAVLVLGLLVASCSQQAADKTPPTVSLAASKTSLEGAGSITLTAEASDDKGVTKVEFFQGETKLGEDTSKPYTLDVSLSATNNGILSYTAKAHDASGKTGSSEVVKVTVDIDNVAPKIDLTASTSSLNSTGSVTLSANATDNKGVVKVEFFKGATKLGEDTTGEDGFKFVVNLTAEDNGSLKYTAKAHDAKGNVGVSAEVSVTIDIDTTKPSISLTSDKTTLTEAGSIELAVSANDNKGIVKIEFFEGGNKLGEDTEAPFAHQISYTADNNGTHTYTAKATDPSGNSSVSEPLTITIDIDITSPTVSLSADKTDVTTPSPAVLKANAADNKGVVKVEFYEGDNKLGEDTSAPFTLELNFTAVHNGTHSYTAKAFDARGNSATSEAVTVVVNIDATAPSVSLVSDKDSLNAVGEVTLTATASDNIGITRVEFFNGATKLGEKSSAPFTWTVSLNQTYSGTMGFSARAYDAEGNMATSNTVNVAVDIDATAPTVSLTTPSTAITAMGFVTLTANASDNKGIAKVEFYKGETKLGETNASPYTYPVMFIPPLNGTHTYTAKAIDTSGNVGTSDSLTIVVDIESSPPSLELSASSTNVTTAGKVTLTATASDNVGIARVEFYKDITNKLGEDSEAPYTWDLNFTAADNGTHFYIAKAYDAAGNFSTKHISIVVDIDVTPPSVSLATSSSNVTTAGSITLTATATDNKAIGKVEFYKGATKLGEDDTSPYELAVAISATDNGTQSFTAKATDTSGNSTTSDAVSVTVDIDATAPIVSLASSNTSVTAAGTFTLTATASDTNGIAKVEFYEGATKLGEDVSSPYTWDISAASLSEGAHTYTAKATDTSGNSTTSNSVGVVVRIFTQLSMGDWHSCALTVAGNAYCWGTNSSGQVGNSSTTSVSKATAVEMPSGVTFTQISAGGEHNCAIGSNSRAYCWGNNSSGRLGNGGSTDVTKPTLVSLPSGVTGFSQVSAGNLHSCGLASDGRVYCWGNNSDGRLGVSTSSYTNSLTAIAVSLPSGATSFSKLSSGSGRHTCAYASDDKWYCWGYNAQGELGNGTKTSTTDGVPVMVNVPSGVSFSAIYVRTDSGTGFGSSCAMGSDGKAYCWGLLGGGISLTAVSTTSLPSGVSFSSMAPGGLFLCGQGSDNKTYCKGDNEYGQLGNGSNTHSGSSFVAVSSGTTTFSGLITGNRHSCAIGSDSSTYCWGLGTGGQLGNGSSSNSNVPVKVVF